MQYCQMSLTNVLFLSFFFVWPGEWNIICCHWRNSCNFETNCQLTTPMQRIIGQSQPFHFNLNLKKAITVSTLVDLFHLLITSKWKFSINSQIGFQQNCRFSFAHSSVYIYFTQNNWKCCSFPLHLNSNHEIGRVSILQIMNWERQFMSQNAQVMLQMW